MNIDDLLGKWRDFVACNAKTTVDEDTMKTISDYVADAYNYDLSGICSTTSTATGTALLQQGAHRSLAEASRSFAEARRSLAFPRSTLSTTPSHPDTRLAEVRCLCGAELEWHSNMCPTKFGSMVRVKPCKVCVDAQEVRDEAYQEGWEAGRDENPNV